MSKQQRIHELTEILNKANKAYYNENREIITNLEYDALYDELKALEGETGIVLGGSPTANVGYKVADELPKEQHETRQLSLNKTKETSELEEWLDVQNAVISWKLDGLTVVVTYKDGKLLKALTRGNGEIGETVTENARAFLNLPLSIAYKDELIVRGEAVITYSDFNEMNTLIGETEAKYKNPRNLASGSVRQLNSRVTADRRVRFVAFALVGADTEFSSRKEQFDFLSGLGFFVAEHEIVTKETVKETVERFGEKIKSYDIPSDGLVLLYDDIKYGESLGTTSKFPRDAIAFKWTDELAKTTLKEIEWSASRTGLINPVAIFEPVELEGTTVSRASVHNVSIMKNLSLGIGDEISVYKANMIIPQIAENFTKSGNAPIPEHCPVCGGETSLKNENDVECLYCINPECGAKRQKAFAHFVSRNAMNIEGLSEMTLEKFIGKGFLREFSDMYKLQKYKEEIVCMEGFGEKSCHNLLEGIDISRKTSAERLLYSLGIAGIGRATARDISLRFNGSFDDIRNAGYEEFVTVDGVGDVLAAALSEYFADSANGEALDRLLNELTLEKVAARVLEDSPIAGKVFVITGSLVNFENRDALKRIIEEKGGKVTGSVTSKTDALINNDVMSTSSKNKKAKELGVEIITEEEFVERYTNEQK